MNFDAIIIGAGAAGLMCAIEAGRRGRKIAVLEKGIPAQKIRISGGGRCNFTNRQVGPANYISQNPRFCVSALKRFTPDDFITMLNAHGIACYEKTLGQLFCRESAQQIIDMLLDECARAQVQIKNRCTIHHISKSGDMFEIDTGSGVFSSQSLVIATGGPSIPKMGATGFGYDIARSFGIRVVAPRPGLAGLVFDNIFLQRTKDLAGIAANVEITCAGQKFREALLFTHRGLSGPAVLQISSYWQPGLVLNIDFAPGTDMFEFLVNARKSSPARALHNVLGGMFPKRLAVFLCNEAELSGRLADMSNEKLRRAAGVINNWQVTPEQTEGFASAEVTIGGVDTAELSSKTFESKNIPGLYFIGEVIDVTGHLGGYNFQWAWASGHAAGQYV